MFFNPIYLLFLAKTRIRRRHRTPSRTYLPLYLDGDSDEEGDYIIRRAPATQITSPVAASPNRVAVVVSDSDDESPATAGRDPTSTAISTSHSASVNENSNSEDEYIFSDIELTDALIAMLDKTNSPPIYPDSDDGYDIISDIELTDDLIAVLDKTYSPPIFPDSDDQYDISDIELNNTIIAELDKIC
jgi:hypothetical protein